MKKTLSFVALFIFFLTFSQPVFSSNHSAIAQPGDSGAVAQPGDAGAIAQPRSGGSSGGSITLMNPLGEGSTLMGFFTDILAVLLVFAVPIIVFFIIFAGFKYVVAQGKPGEIETANRMLLYVVIGGLIILGANIILAVLKGTIDAFVI